MDEIVARGRIESALTNYKQEFGSFFIAKMLGLEILYQENSCIIKFPVEDFLFNPQGTYHGGMLATIMDISMGHLIKEIAGKAGITLEMKNQFLRPLLILKLHWKKLRLMNRIVRPPTRKWTTSLTTSLLRPSTTSQKMPSLLSPSFLRIGTRARKQNTMLLLPRWEEVVSENLLIRV